MKGLAKCLDFQCRTGSRQIPLPEVWLSKCQVDEDSPVLEHSGLRSEMNEGKGGSAEEFHPLPYYNHGRLVQVDPGLLVWCWLQATPRLLTHTLPSADIMASIMPLCDQNLLPTWDQNKRLPLSTATSKVPSAGTVGPTRSSLALHRGSTNI